MLENALDRDPVGGFDLEDLVKEVLDFVRDAAAELHAVVDDVVVDVLDLLGTEG